MAYHSIATYKEMPEDIKQLVPVEYVKEKFIEDLPRRLNYINQEDWNIVRSILSDQEVQTILNDIKKKSVMPSKFTSGYFFGGEDDLESYFAKENEKINKLPLIYRQELFNIVEQIRQKIKLELESGTQDTIAFSKNWFKRAIIERPITYESYGHSDYETMETDPDYPNYIWIFRYGDIIAREETGDIPTHQDAFGLLGISIEKAFRGRYDSKQDVITILKPYGISSFRESPELLVYKLKEKFSRSAKIIDFS
jgi:glutaredoxin-related protein